MTTRDESYQKRAFRRRKTRRHVATDPISATDRKRLGDDRGIAASVVRGALVHIASAGSAAVLDDVSGFRSEDDYKDARDAVLASFGEMDPESAEHIESLLIRVCSSDRFWSAASDAVRHAESPPTAAELEGMVSSVPMPPGLFCGDERVAMVEPHTQMVIGPLRVQDSLSFSVWPLYKSGSRGSRPVRLPLSEAGKARRGRVSYLVGVVGGRCVDIFLGRRVRAPDAGGPAGPLGWP